MAFQHQGVALAHLRRRLADGDGAGDVGGAVQVLGPGIDQQQAARLGLADLRAGRPVVDDGAVGAGAGDGVERQVLQRPGGFAQALQLGDDLHLVRQARLGVGGQPVQEAGQGHAVALVRAPGPFDLDLVLAGLGQGAGIGRAHDRGAGAVQDIQVPGRRRRRIDGDPLALQRLQRVRQRLGTVQAHLIAEPRRQIGRHLVRVQEQPRGPVGVQHRLAQRQGRADHVAAADVEQPRDRGRGGDHRRLDAEVRQALADAGALGRGVLTGIGQRVGDHRGLGLAGPLGAPGRVQRIVGHRLQFGAGLGGRVPQPVERIGAVQLGIEADHLALGGGGLQPGRHPALDDVAHLEQALVDLVAHLQGVAAVHEDRGLVPEDHRRPGRAGEAGGPGQAVVGRRQIFVLVLVLVRDDQAVQTLGGHGLADQGQVLGPK